MPECMVLLSVPDQIWVKPNCLLVIISRVTWKQSTIISLYLIWSLFYSIPKKWLWPYEEQYDYSCWSCLDFRLNPGFRICRLTVFTLQPRICSSSVMWEFAEDSHLVVRKRELLQCLVNNHCLLFLLCLWRQLFPSYKLSLGSKPQAKPFLVQVLNASVHWFLPTLTAVQKLIRHVELLGFIRKFDAEDCFLASVDCYLLVEQK